MGFTGTLRLTSLPPRTAGDGAAAALIDIERTGMDPAAAVLTFMIILTFLRFGLMCLLPTFL